MVFTSRNTFYFIMYFTGSIIKEINTQLGINVFSSFLFSSFTSISTFEDYQLPKSPFHKCNIMAEGFRFMPLGLVRLRTFRLSSWVT